MSRHHAKPRKRRGPGRALLRWHRRIGIALSAIFILICATGILLNHSSDLSLHQHTVKASWIYRWYHIEPTGTLLHWQTPHGSIAHLDGSLYFGPNEIGRSNPPISVASREHFIAVATQDSILLLTPTGEMIETLSGNALPDGQISAVSTQDTECIRILTTSGSFESDPDLLSWHLDTNPPPLSNSQPTPAPEELEAELLAAFRGDGLSWNRIILDLHSGRFFGAAGKWIADLSALGLIILTLSGIIYTLKYLKKARERSGSQNTNP